MSVAPVANGSVVEVTAFNEFQANELMNNAKLVQHLRERLGNPQLTIRATVDTSAKPTNVVYTRQQKFDKMMEKNEQFGKLVERFSLRLE